jgi:hypothetical protein
MYVRRYPELWLWMHRRWREPGAAQAFGRESFFDDGFSEKP